MNIGILTICTGSYNVFFEGLYSSLEKNFLKDHNKTYYVFTDSYIENHENVINITQEKLGWPFDTMMRFHMFNKIKETLLKEEFLFFFNVNMKALTEINDEVLPNENNDFLMGALHPGFYNSPINTFPYDRNPECSCCIPFNKGSKYYQGCFNGGSSIEFMKMSEILADNIDKDIKNNITPIWHDESQLNWYYKDKNILTLPYSYIYPESWVHLPLSKIMIQRDKSKYGGHEFLRK